MSEDKAEVRKSEVVKSVLYAVVASAWASVMCNLVTDVPAFLQAPKDISVLLRETGNHGAAFMGIGVFVFLTLYFHDEWKYNGKWKGYPQENLAIQCIGWSFFLFQVCLIGSCLEASSICGIMGTGIITYGLFQSLGLKEALKNRFVWENVVWIVVLIVFVIFIEGTSNWQTWLLITPAVFVLLRCCLKALGLPKERKCER